MNAFTIDVEDYFHVTAFAAKVSPKDWDSLPSRVEANTDRILALLQESGQKATFFVLGWVAERHPVIVRRIAEQGHEVACHSFAHQFVYQLGPDKFREDTRRAKLCIEDAGGQAVQGYRAPSFSIRKDSLWALDILTELGFNYDSSIFPVVHPNYGMPTAPRFPFRMQTANGPITEFPMATLEWRGKRAPIGGGAYLRILPYSYTRWGISHINNREQQPVSVYLHPWELDPDQPRISAGATATLRHYTGVTGGSRKIKRLLQDFSFAPMRELLSRMDPSHLPSFDAISTN